jgi:cyclic beta-1,2-glucan synthetase
LAHQTLVALDAIIRTVVRSTVTHSRLLEWETATEAELGIKKRTPVDIYLNWVPVFAIPIGIASFFRPGAAPYAAPFVVAWSCSRLISLWLNRSPHGEDFDLTPRDHAFLREVCLRTWRYFCEFSNENNHWLIPDNVQQDPDRIAERISPTNLGLLLNSRQVALEFGYLTLSEFVTQTERTLATMHKLPRHFGHFLNWYDNLTLAPLEPRFVSSVDSGNLIASLWSLKNHCLELRRQGVAQPPVIAGLAEHYKLAGIRAKPPGDIKQLPDSLPTTSGTASAEQQWWLAQANSRLAAIRREITMEAAAQDDISLRLLRIANECDRFVGEMDFAKLVNPHRRLLSVGYDVTNGQLAASCYDLLASEARCATFIAVAKGQAPQESWFRLGRQHTIAQGENVLISWTGTMFEYLMPVIWMRSHPNTLLDRSVHGAVRAQESYAAERRVPWGISEAAYSAKDELGNYQYAAFGVPSLALNVARAGSLVISPYSTCLALLVDPAIAVENLRRMARFKWLADYGFYESADFTPFPSQPFLRRKYALVRCWMSHHQGMTLAALCNLFHNSAFQRWFHAERLVQASELILQERPLRAPPSIDEQPRRVLTFVRPIIKRI